MIERVARAARDAYHDARNSEAFVNHWEAIALAAIKAMREPTQDMEIAGTEQWLCEAAMEDRSGANWRAMIDAALKETP